MVKRQFDYEENYQYLQNKIEELKEVSKSNNYDISDEIELLEKRLKQTKEEKYQNLSSWEKVLLSRHAERPGIRDYIQYLCNDDFIELHGDRCFGDDRAIVGGIGIFAKQPLTIIGHQKGKNTTDNINFNFGMPHPEGYRKVHRLLLQAEKFKRPVITFIDTPGAFPGVGAEERGQAWAISQLLMTLSNLEIPVIAIVTGEGGSGGALALAVGDRLAMLSNAVFSVASPEACTSILWNDLEKIEEMASALKITANDLYEMDIIDTIIEEPSGGAHLDFEKTADNIKMFLKSNLDELLKKEKEVLLHERYMKLRKIGKYKIIQENCNY